MRVLVGLISFTLLAAQSASADTSTAVARCFPASVSGWSIFLKWDKTDSYRREIFARLAQAPCSKWKQEIASPAGWGSFEETETSIYDERIPAKVLGALHQIRRGANVLHAESSGEQYLKNHPIDGFSVDTNRALAAKYGMGFTGDIYRAWLERDPNNKRARDLFLENFNRARNDEIHLHPANTIALVEMGIGWDYEIRPDTPEYTRNFLEEFPRNGVKTEFLKNESYGSMGKNVELIAPQIEEKLKQGYDVILVSLSRGAPEILDAAVRVLKKWSSPPKGFGRISAVVNLSGMMHGTFFADAVNKIPARQAVSDIFKDSHLSSLVNLGDYLYALGSMTEASTDQMDLDFINDLPSDVVYLNGVGILTDDGLLHSSNQAMNPFIDYNRKHHLVSGANDGFVEFPKNILPRDVAPKNYTVTFEGSHMLVDGSLGSIDLGSSSNRIAAFQALFATVLDLSRD